MRASLLVLVALFGCAPRYGNGHLRCAPTGKPCPDDYHCAWNGSCWHDGEDPPLGEDSVDFATASDGGVSASDGSVVIPGSDASGGSDGGIVAPADLATLPCMTSGRPTNFEGCQLPPSEGDWIAATATYETSGPGAGLPQGALFSQTNGPTVRVIQVATFKVPAGVTLYVGGSPPLLVVADTVEIAGTIRVFASGKYLKPCGGGGGDGTGVPGSAGAGPGCPNGPTGCAELVPLIGGCDGAEGFYEDGTTFGGIGASPTDALQITARSTITVTGTINAGGWGGTGGDAHYSYQSGGGGGSSGGAIFLEAPTVTLASSARLCANGGGGGGGGDDTVDVDGTSGMEATCDDTPAGGGPGSGAGGAGGKGGHRSHPAGYAGQSGTSGGGGGGGVGRIRIRSQNANPSGSALVTPAPLEG